MQNSNVRQLNNFKHSGLTKKGLLYLLYLILIISVTLVAVIVARGDDTLVNTTPQKIGVIDNAKSDADNTAWFNGYDQNGNVLSRYESYGIAAGNIKDALGTEDCPYIIENGLEMANLASIVNGGNNFNSKYIRIVGSKKSDSQPNNVVDLVSASGILYQSDDGIKWVTCDFNNNNLIGWTPIGNSQSNSFDGNIYADDGVKIYNLSAKLTDQTVFGLFGYLGENANVTGLDLVDTQIYYQGSTSNVKIGTVAGVSGAANITDCSVAPITSGKRTATGDGTPIVASGSSNYYVVPDFMISTKASNCVVGGVVGQVNNSSSIKNCKVNGTISVNSGVGVGNIAGSINCDNTNAVVNISDISGSANIITPSTGSMYNVGGVVGNILSSTSVNISNIGSKDNKYVVNLTGNAYAAHGGEIGGGISGVVGDSVAQSLIIDKCYVSVDACVGKSDSSNNNFYFGGILGRSEINDLSSTLGISNCNVSDTKFYSKVAGESGIKITIGGFIGGINYPLGTSYVRDCTADNIDLSTDGFSGGITGTAMSSSTSNIKEYTNCVVNDLHIIQESKLPDGQSGYFLIGGVTAATDDKTTIESCQVNNFVMDSIVSSNGASYNQIGGIVGRSIGTTIKNSSADTVFNLGIVNTVTGVMVGGIAGTSKGSNISGCSALIDQNQVTEIENRVGLDDNKQGTVFSIENGVLENFVTGGIVGYSFGTTSISNSFASGDINIDTADNAKIGERQNSIGGLVGINVSGLTVSKCFSTVSLAGNMQDAIGGLMGYNDSNTDVNVSNYYYGGALLNPYSASITKYTKGGTFTNVSKNSVYAPNAATGDDSISGVAQSTSVPSAIASATSAVNPVYYALATTNSVTFSGEHVFAVSDDLGTAGYEIKDNNFTSNGITVRRRVKLIENKMGTAENGLDVPFTVSSDADLVAMQKYVAIGGGFLGSQYSVTSDFSTALNASIGMADADYQFALDENLPFCGDFIGNNHTITYTSRTAPDSQATFDGLFGYVENSLIENLNIVYTSKSNLSATAASGGLVGCAAFSDINGVSVKANNTLTLSGTYKGGMCGISKSTAFNKTGNTPLYFSGKLCGGGSLGGLIGFANNTVPTYYVHQNGGSNIADFYNKELKYPYSNMHNSYVKNSYVSGDIVGSTTDDFDSKVNSNNTASKVGGMVGCTNVFDTLIDSSFVYGNVTGGAYVGGLVGYLERYASTVVNNSYVRGDIYANTNAGGIIGYVKTSSKVASHVLNTYFVGQIDCTDTFGALSSSPMGYNNFRYDKQVCGDISIYPGKDDDELAERNSTEMSSATQATDYYVSAYDVFNGKTMSTNPFVADGGATISVSSASFIYTKPTTVITDPEQRLIKNGDNNRLNIKNTSSSTYNVTITFVGSKFSLYDYVSGGHDAYAIDVDGVTLTNSGNVARTQYGTSSLSWCTQSAKIGDNNVGVSYIGTSTDKSNQLVFLTSNEDKSTNGGNGNLPSSMNDNVVNSLNLTGLSNSQHTIKITGVYTKSNSYMNIRGFYYGSTSSDAQQSATYPTIDFFNDNAPEISAMTTKINYAFSGNDFVTARNFAKSSQLDVNHNNYKDDLSSNVGVTKTGDTYTCDGNITDGNTFTITTTNSVGGYSLSINEKIIVIPFEKGDGTKDSPYGIINVKQLIAFKNFVNNVYNGAGLYFKLTMTTDTAAHSTDGNTYDLTGDDQAAGSDKMTVNDWESIGTSDSRFQGDFDGNGKSITGINIESSSTGVYGLFGYTVDASIHNVSLSGQMSMTVASGASSGSVGLLAGYINSTNVSNVTASVTSMDVTTKGNLTGYVSVGGLIGRADNTCTVDSALMYGDIVVNGNYSSSDTSARPYFCSNGAFDNASYMSVGGIIGYANQSNENSVATIKNSISNADMSVVLANENIMSAVNIGGAIGYSLGANNTSTNVTDIATFGNTSNSYGSTGGVIGSAAYSASGSNRKVNVLNCYCGTSIVSGNSAYSGTQRDIHIGGIAGSFYLASDLATLTDCTFGGELNFAQPTENIDINAYIGGIVGRTKNDSSKSASCYFDLTKNSDLSVCGDNNPIDTSVNTIGDSTCLGKSSASLVSNGMYNYTFKSGIDFANTAANNMADLILKSNLTFFGIVRTDPVFSVYSTDDTLNSGYNKAQQISYMQLSSAFISGDSGAVLSVTDDTNNTVMTVSNRRVLSIKSSTESAVTAQIVKLVDGKDIYLGQGKKITYYPDTTDVGKSDSSYYYADNGGDGIHSNTADNSFAVYHADQLMGIDALVNGKGEDGFGNPVSTVTDGYTVYIQNDISFTDIDYDLGTDGVQSMIIGSVSHPFKSTVDGQQHTIYGLTQNDNASVGLFAATDGAVIKNLGITDSVFTLNSDGIYVGSFVGVSKNTDYSKCFSSSRVQMNKYSSGNVNMGGFAGMSNGDTYQNCFFTGSIGKTAVDNSSYVSVGDDVSVFAGGFAGNAVGNVDFNACYASTYIDTAINYDEATDTYRSNIGYLIGKETASNVTATDCSFDYNSGAESCSPVGGNSSVTAPTLTATNGLYPSVWNESARSAREVAARISTTFSTAASSMSRVDISVGSLSSDNYYSAYTVNGGNTPLYDLDGQSATRVNSGIASVLIKYIDDNTGTMSYRMVSMNMQCWYDNFTVVDGKKVYVIKNYSDLQELAQMVDDKTDANVGHTHSVKHTAPGIAEDSFNGAIIKLGANIAVNGNVINMIGKTADTEFAGSFDGNGYTITNASFESVNNLVGMFGYISDTSVISNLMFAGTSNVIITSSSSSTVYGGTAVAMYNNGIVKNCMNGAQINVTNNSTQKVFFGGVTGNVASGKTLSYCYNMGHIVAKNDNMFLSGIVGVNAGQISLCYNTGMIEGYTNSDDIDYTQNTTVSGISASNSGTVSTCYNSAVLSNYGKNMLYPIASGTVTSSYVNGQFLSSDFNYEDTANGYEYSSGITVLSADRMSDGRAIDGFGDEWVFNQGYYPQFAMYFDSISGARRVASTVSALATTLTAASDDTATFGSFLSIKFKYGTIPFSIEKLSGTLSEFNSIYSDDGLRMVVTKRGAATIFINRNSADVLFSRENYFINEETFSVRYMFDFSELTKDAQQTDQRTYQESSSTLNTFATADSRLGSGTAGDPYLINTTTDLTAFAKYINSSTTGGEGRYFKLIRDIDCSGVSYAPIGTKSNPFKGNFNGNGYTVSGITSSGYDYNGLFGYADSMSEINLVAIKNSHFTAKTALAADTYTGAIAGYTDGKIANCYSRAVVEIPKATESSTKTLYVGGLVGSIDSDGLVQACYARPAIQQATNNNYVPDGSNTILSFTSYSDVVCGILAGKVSGTMDGCYHTSVYYEPTGYKNISTYGIIAGWLDGGTVKNVFYDFNQIPSASRYIFVKYGSENYGVVSENGNSYARTTLQMQRTESAACTDGVANDSMALELSSNIYLGTYEMASLPSSAQSKYSNDGYPMLMAFDVLQYKFASFDSNNFVLFMQNVDASSPKLMNSLCSIDNYSFPTYADITAKEKLSVDVLSLPNTIGFNVSAVGYGFNDSSQIKWTVVNGVYTDNCNLDEGDDSKGAAMIDRVGTNGKLAIKMNTTNLLPSYCNKLYVYITLVSNSKSSNNWGIDHTWASSALEDNPEDELLDND